jgi:hypothetical protein
MRMFLVRWSRPPPSVYLASSLRRLPLEASGADHLSTPCVDLVSSPRLAFIKPLGALLVFQHLVGVPPLVAIHPIALYLILACAYFFDEVTIITGCQALPSIIAGLSPCCLFFVVTTTNQLLLTVYIFGKVIIITGFR